MLAHRHKAVLLGRGFRPKFSITISRLTFIGVREFFIAAKFMKGDRRKY